MVHKLSNQKYSNTENGRNNNKRKKKKYRNTAKGRETERLYSKIYNQTDTRKASNRLHHLRYKKTPQGKAAISCYKNGFLGKQDQFLTNIQSKKRFEILSILCKQKGIKIREATLEIKEQAKIAGQKARREERRKLLRRLTSEDINIINDILNIEQEQISEDVNNTLDNNDLDLNDDARIDQIIDFFDNNKFTEEQIEQWKQNEQLPSFSCFLNSDMDFDYEMPADELDGSVSAAICNGIAL